MSFEIFQNICTYYSSQKLMLNHSSPFLFKFRDNFLLSEWRDLSHFFLQRPFFFYTNKPFWKPERLIFWISELRFVLWYHIKATYLNDKLNKEIDYGKNMRHPCIFYTNNLKSRQYLAWLWYYSTITLLLTRTNDVCLQ